MKLINTFKASIGIVFILILFACGSNSYTAKEDNTVNKSNKDRYSESSASPYFFVIRIKQNIEDTNEKEVCILKPELNHALDECKLNSQLVFEINDDAYLIDSENCFSNIVQVNNYDLKLVDSLETNLVPTLADSIKNEARNKKYDLLWNYYAQYDKYFIHALVRKGFVIYKDVDSGYPVVEE